MAHVFYLIPGVKALVRDLVRFSVQRIPMPLKAQQQLYNFFAADPALRETVFCHTLVPGGGSLTLELHLEDWISRIWFYYGYHNYERKTVQLILKLLESKKCFIDVGANVGYYTLLAASVLNGRGQVHAFEPIPYVFRWLSGNVQLNKLQGVYLTQAALSDVDGQAKLFLPSELSSAGEASLIQDQVDRGTHLKVETMRFDTYCRVHNVTSVDLIKMDVEGGELHVLQGMGHLLAQWAPDLICEVHEPFDHLLDQFFSSKPYRKFIVTDDGLREVDRIKAHSNPDYRNYYLSCNPVFLESQEAIPSFAGGSKKRMTPA